ncbi:hypothetical protein G7Z17_g8817 [Cylindrodendrum hubeiense]|uniref:Uncharacterized protein n=1 Tax=Cylindrodendrum hubeiense TaxID=595255 RepID=A0A9P5H2U3_9HYPO|nr:hypothetical protein G7Z17_g8817 [Cylindrodendrum hubeiense]
MTKPQRPRRSRSVPLPVFGQRVFDLPAGCFMRIQGECKNKAKKQGQEQAKQAKPRRGRAAGQGRTGQDGAGQAQGTTYIELKTRAKAAQTKLQRPQNPTTSLSSDKSPATDPTLIAHCRVRGTGYSRTPSVPSVDPVDPIDPIDIQSYRYSSFSSFSSSSHKGPSMTQNPKHPRTRASTYDVRLQGKLRDPGDPARHSLDPASARAGVGYGYRYGMDRYGGPTGMDGNVLRADGYCVEASPLSCALSGVSSRRDEIRVTVISPLRHARAADSPAALLDLAWQRPSGQGDPEWVWKVVS